MAATPNISTSAALAADPGSLEDSLPFEANGEKLASIAWRTWVYTDTGPKRFRYGYLRAGAIVDRRGPPIVNDGCQGGWYRINPRGFVCIGKGATLDLEHPVVVASARRPKRGDGLPYDYALSSDRPPHLYFRLPSTREMNDVEGEPVAGRALNWRLLAKERGLLEVLDIQPRPPDFLLEGKALDKPYGVDSGLRTTTHSGQASRDAGFALQTSFEWEGRTFGLTTELDVIALDRTKVVKPSTLEGLKLGPSEDLPVAVVRRGYAARYERDEQGQFHARDSLPPRSMLALTGKSERQGARFWEARDGHWIADNAAMIVQPRDSFPSVATGNRKWIDLSIKTQLLVAYSGRKADFVTLVSTGRGELGDPEETQATVRGTFMIHSKHISSTMDGEEDKSDSFQLRDVPFVQYFHKGYALHGTYWHDKFGRVRSHGCVNLSPHDSAFLFEWTDPPVPEGWHGALNKDRGTVVYIHP